jgi:hypothetical protein
MQRKAPDDPLVRRVSELAQREYKHAAVQTARDEEKRKLEERERRGLLGRLAAWLRRRPAR